MAKQIKKHSKTALVLGLMISMALVYNFVAPVQSAQITNREVRLADSRPSATAVDYDFLGDYSANAGCIRVRFCDSATTCTASPTGMSLAPADKGDSGDWSGFTYANWSLTTVVGPPIEARYANGTPANGGAGGSFEVGNLTNSSAAGTYFAWINTYATDVGCASGTPSGTAVDDGIVAFAIISGISVSATVAETLTFAISGQATCAPGSGNAVTTTAGTLPFGALTAATFYKGCHQLSVTANAGGGYSISSQETDQMTSGTNTIQDTDCNAGTCTQTVTTAAIWTTTTVDGFGYTCDDGTAAANTRCASNFENATGFVQYASAADSEAPQTFITSTTSAPSSEITTVASMVLVLSTQLPGTYTNTISFVVTPNYD